MNFTKSIEKESFLKWDISSIIIILLFMTSVYPGDWSVSGNAGYMTGNYIYTTTTSIYSFTGEIAYETNRWNADLNLPVIMQNSGLVSSSGGMHIPSNQGQNESGMSGGRHGGMMGGSQINTDGMDTQYETGFGDIYLSGQYYFLRDKKIQPALALTANIKVPTASTNKNLGTGKWDYGLTLNISKSIGKYVGFLDSGFRILGDPAEINYSNPIIYGVGVGRFFNGGKFSALLYYQGYSEILQNYDPPRQGSAGLYYKTNPRSILSIVFSKGFSKTSPDFGTSIGFNIQL
ncbi:MAG: transporter [Calditrichaceae bacterium]